jgi:hypothetical protein
MRHYAIVLTACLAACGSLGGEGPSALVPSTPTATGHLTAAPPPTAAHTARPTTPTTLDCTVTWTHGYLSIDLLTENAELIVRGTVVSSGTVQLKAFGANNAVSLRSARRTTLRVTETLKQPSGAPPTEVNVVEDVCPNLSQIATGEWILFARRFDPPYAPDDGRVYYVTEGGPQGQFRLENDRVIGPFFRFARVVHSYEGASAQEVRSDVAAVRAIDIAGGRALIERYGWKILRAPAVRDMPLPKDFSQDDGAGAFQANAVASRSIGLELHGFAGQVLRGASFSLDFDRPSTEKQDIATVLFDPGGRVVGAWLTVGHDLGRWELFPLSQRDQARAAGGRV